jgi:hypothetical protein
MARLSFLEPLFLGGAVLSLAFAFWSVYRKPKDCADGTCATTSQRRMRWFVWIACTALCILLALAFAPMFSARG